VTAAKSIDQLRGDSDAVRRLANTPFEHMRHAELLRHVAHIEGFALELECRVASDHFECRNLGQVGRDVLADSVAEIFLLGISAHVRERKNADGHALP